MQNIVRDQFSAGLAALRQPVLPLVRIVLMVYLTGPFATVDEVLTQLTEPIDTGKTVYDNPADLLAPYLPTLKKFERLKDEIPLPWLILDDHNNELNFFEAIDAWVSQTVLDQELETINSLLCGPCGCTLCCTGPDRDMAQLFFEIPIADTEIALFPLPLIDSSETRRQTAHDEPPACIDSQPFYKTDPALYYWQTGASLILSKETRCPHLEPNQGYCLIYRERPQVCRKPQIFPYILERQHKLDRTVNAKPLPAFIYRQKLLAVWDCPYVMNFKDEIADYAALCGAEVLFKQNKT